MLLLDTHAWVWWLTKPERLGRKAARAIDKADRLGVCAMSPWEVGMKAESGKLRFNRPWDLWIDEALAADERIELLQVLPRISATAVKLAWSHGDPVDRLIVATALVHGASLVTADEAIRASKLVRCIWD